MRIGRGLWRAVVVALDRCLLAGLRCCWGLRPVADPLQGRPHHPRAFADIQITPICRFLLVRPALYGGRGQIYRRITILTRDRVSCSDYIESVGTTINNLNLFIISLLTGENAFIVKVELVHLIWKKRANKFLWQ